MNTAKTGIAALIALTLSAPSWGALNPVPGPVFRPQSQPDAVHPGMYGTKRKTMALETDTGAALPGPNGEILYPYGASHPEVQCAPLHLCVVRLLAGEQIVDLSIGDSVRWLVQAAQAGTRPVVIIKPITTGIETNLVITTDDGHLYDLNLVARRTQVVPEVGFYDPKALVERVARAQARKTERAQTLVATLPHITPEDLDFAYWWTGPRAYRPVRASLAADSGD